MEEKEKDKKQEEGDRKHRKCQEVNTLFNHLLHIRAHNQQVIYSWF